MKGTCLLTLLLLAACSPRNSGDLALVNSGVEATNIAVDGRNFTVFPSHHITKKIEAGRHEIRVGDLPAVKVDVVKDKTTLFDSTGLSCFAVVDFAQRWHGGNPQIIERIKQKQIFITKDNMASALGSLLPKKPKPNEPVLRIHQLDCEIVNNDSAIIGEVINLP